VIKSRERTAGRAASSGSAALIATFSVLNMLAIELLQTLLCVPPNTMTILVLHGGGTVTLCTYCTARKKVSMDVSTVSSHYHLLDHLNAPMYRVNAWEIGNRWISVVVLLLDYVVLRGVVNVCHMQWTWIRKSV